MDDETGVKARLLQARLTLLNVRSASRSTATHAETRFHEQQPNFAGPDPAAATWEVSEPRVGGDHGRPQAVYERAMKVDAAGTSGALEAGRERDVTSASLVSSGEDPD